MDAIYLVELLKWTPTDCFEHWNDECRENVSKVCWVAEGGDGLVECMRKIGSQSYQYNTLELKMHQISM